METLPSDTVTFLFTDIEGSTKFSAEGSTMTLEQVLALTDES